MPEAHFSMLPFRSVPAYAEPIVRAVGLAAINWGKMEQHLEMLLRHVNRDDFITGAVERFPDTSFRIKSQLFETWYARHPHFAAVHHIARPLLIGMKKANTSRVRLFHSNVQGFEEGPPPVMNVAIVKGKGDDIEVSQASWTAKQIEYFSEVLAHISEDFAHISKAVMNEDFRKSLRKE